MAYNRKEGLNAGPSSLDGCFRQASRLSKAFHSPYNLIGVIPVMFCDNQQNCGAEAVQQASSCTLSCHQCCDCCHQHCHHTPPSSCSSGTEGYDLVYGCDGCGYYRSCNRDPFWPSFSHPRWLSLESLYSGCHSSCCSCENEQNLCQQLRCC